MATKTKPKSKAKAKAKVKVKPKAKASPRKKTPGVVANRKAARGISKKSHRVLVTCPEDHYKKAVKAGLVFSQIFQVAVAQELVRLGAIELAVPTPSEGAGGEALSTEAVEVTAVPADEFESDGA